MNYKVLEGKFEFETRCFNLESILAHNVHIVKAASLMQLNRDPPPTLLRARLAAVLDHLPSVPSVVLPIMSLTRNSQALLLLNLVFIELH